MKVYVVVQAKHWSYEGYDFPKILGLYFDKELAEKDFPQPEELDFRFDDDYWVWILGPYELKSRDD